MLYAKNLDVNLRLNLGLYNMWNTLRLYLTAKFLLHIISKNDVLINK